MSGFDYRYTCPAIDKNIDDTKHIIESHISSIMLELSPLLQTLCNLPSEVQEWVDGATEDLYRELEDTFENLRSSNEDMRTSADLQIRELESELEDALIEIKVLEEAD